MAFPAKLELWGCVRPCAVPTQAAPTVRGRAQLFGQYGASNVTRPPRQRHHTVTNIKWGICVGEQYSDQLPFDVGTLRIPIWLVSLLHSVIFHLHENQTLTHLHYSACPTTLSCPGHLSLTQASWWDTGEKSLVRWKNHALPSYALCLQSNSSEVTELLQMNRNEAKNPAFPACLPLM